MAVLFADEALADLAAAVAFIAPHRPRAALELIDRIFAAAERLAAGEFDGPELEIGGERVRSWPVEPYRLIYRRDAGSLTILRVYHQRRRPLS